MNTGEWGFFMLLEADSRRSLGQEQPQRDLQAQIRGAVPEQQAAPTLDVAKRQGLLN
jgi:hypothetical protein